MVVAAGVSALVRLTSATSWVVPELVVYVDVRPIELPFSAVLVAVACRLIEVMPSCDSVLSSPASTLPSPFASTHTCSCLKIASLALIAPSWLVSYCASASKPLDACRPLGISVPVPNICAPLVTWPAALASTRKPSVVPEVQDTCCEVPVPVMSKATPAAAVVVWMPAPVRSSTIGSAVRSAVTWSIVMLGMSLANALACVVVSECRSVVVKDWIVSVTKAAIWSVDSACICAVVNETISVVVSVAS